MERKSVAFEQLSDIFGFRVIVDTVDDCYRALGVVHTTWPMVPGRFKDYISTPKQNDYRSIHTTVIGPGSQRVELQIRTARHGRGRRIRHRGARALQGRRAPTIRGSPSESRAYQWLRRTVDLLAEGDNPEEFLEHTKLELFHDQVFCFTPKGRLIALPRGATPIDFAYAVHTDVGNTAVGCKINGRMAPLLTELQNGDEVEIVRAEGQTPPAAWESLVVTGKARAAIRRATRAAVRRQYTGLGRQILERAFERAGKTLLGREAEGRPAPPGARSRSRTCWRRSAAARCFPATWSAPSIPTTRTSAAPPRPMRTGGWLGLADGCSAKVQAAADGRGAPSGIPIRGLDARSAGALRARGRRRAGRPHRRHPDAGRRRDDLPDPVAVARRFRQRAGPLDRRALGHRGRAPQRFPARHRAAIDQRARHRSRRSPRSSPTTTAISTTSR